MAGERLTVPSSRRDHLDVCTHRCCYLSTPPVLHLTATAAARLCAYCLYTDSYIFSTFEAPEHTHHRGLWDTIQKGVFPSRGKSGSDGFPNCKKKCVQWCNMEPVERLIFELEVYE